MSMRVAGCAIDTATRTQLAGCSLASISDPLPPYPKRNTRLHQDRLGQGRAISFCRDTAEKANTGAQYNE